MDHPAETAIQDRYDPAWQVCYGCGSRNRHGLQLKSYWDGARATAVYHPRSEQKGFEGYAYGGLIASLIDCHAMATAAAYFREMQGEPDAAPRMVTASLTVQFRHPTPLDGRPLELVAWVNDHSARKAVVAVELSVGRQITATGEVVAVPMPESMKSGTNG